MHERNFASKLVMRLDVMKLNDLLCKWGHRKKRQSKTTIILLANNFVAIIHLFEYNELYVSVRTIGKENM